MRDDDGEEEEEVEEVVVVVRGRVWDLDAKLHLSALD